jgi:hypothetical protein
MTQKQAFLCERLQRLGFTAGTQMKLYGEIFEFLSEPMVLTDDVVLVDAKEKKSGQARRVRVPLPIVHIANGSSAA